MSKSEDGKALGESKLVVSHDQVQYLKDVVSPGGKLLPDGTFVSLTVSRSSIGELPKSNTEGFGANTSPSKINPAVILTLSNEDLIFNFGIYVGNSGDYLAEVSAQEWASISYPSEGRKLRNGMSALFEDAVIDKKRVSILKGERFGSPEKLRSFNDVLGVDIGAVVQSASKAVTHTPEGSEFYSIQTKIGTNINDGFFNWDNK